MKNKSVIGQPRNTDVMASRGAGDPYNFRPMDRNRIAISSQKFAGWGIKSPMLDVRCPEKGK